MDFMEYKSAEAFTKSKKPESMGWFLHFLVLVSIFSFLLSYHSSCPTCFLHFIKLCSAKSLATALNHFMHNKAMLLLVIVFLLYLARNSSSPAPSEFLDDLHDEFVARMGSHQSLQPESFEIEARFEDKEVIAESVRSLQLVVTDEGGATSKLVEKVGGVKNKQVGDGGVDNKLLRDGGRVKSRFVGVDELELLGIDELNKRFEEFIQREKRKRRLEALQLVPV